MSRIFVAGIGAVSPAGWDVAVLRGALEKGEALPVQTLAQPGRENPFSVRPVPAPATRPAFLAHPRLRRSSPITHYAAAAALEAMTGLRASPDAKEFRIGLIVCLQSGCVQYSCRFYDETLKNPATASPLIFPETVYAAPTSHVAALLGNVTLANSLVGDPSSFLQGVVLGAQWLKEHRVDACLVIGAEELHWIIANALWQFDRRAVLAAGAGALCLCRDDGFSTGAELSMVTDAHSYSARCDRMNAAQNMRNQLSANDPRTLLCDGLGVNPHANAAERAVWNDWCGARISPKQILGEGMMAAAAWQCVAACDAISAGRFATANVSLVGFNQQAIGAQFARAGTEPSRSSTGLSETTTTPKHE